MKRATWYAVVAIGAMLMVQPGVAAEKDPAAELNPANEQLLKKSTEEQAAMLAKAVGHSCIGTRPFLMGVIATNPGKGLAYWSLRCAGGGSWVVQLDPQAGVFAIECAVFKEQAVGKECFKKF